MQEIVSFLSPIILNSRRDDLISDGPPVIHEVVNLCSWYNPFHFPSLFVQVQCCPKLQNGSRPSTKIPQKFLIGSEFQPVWWVGFGKTVLVPSLGKVSWHNAIYIVFEWVLWAK